MSLISLIKGMIGQEDGDFEGSLAKKFSTRRAHQRYQINTPKLLKFYYPGYKPQEILDISFKGCLLDGELQSKLPEVQVSTTCHIEGFGVRLPFEVRELQKRKPGVGVIFKSNTSDDMVNLNRLLDPIKLGSTALCVPESHLAERFKNAKRKKFSGDNGFDLVIERDERGGFNFAMVTYRSGGIYASLLIENGVLITKKSLDQTGVGARMAQTPKIDMDIVATAAFACLGMKFTEGAMVAEGIQQIIIANNASTGQ